MEPAKSQDAELNWFWRFLQNPWLVRLLTAPVLLIGLLIWNFIKPDTWLAYVYPDKNDLMHEIPVGYYQSLELCRVEAMLYISNQKLVSAAYKCGLNCDTLSKPYSCETTAQ